MAECSAPHGGESGGGDSEVNGGGRSEGARGGNNMEQVEQIWRGKVITKPVLQCDFLIGTF